LSKTLDGRTPADVQAYVNERGSLATAWPEYAVTRNEFRAFCKEHGIRVRKEIPEAVFSPMRILAIDIETAPSLAYIWRMYDENIGVDQLVKASEMISWGAKWLGDDEVEFRSEFHDGKRKMVKRVWELLDEADVVLHFNGRRFDVPHLQREFLEMKLLPPSPYKQIDLYATVKRQFRFQSNKLAHVSKQLGFAGKVEHEGFPLWLKCMAGDEDAWARMCDYNRQDVVLLEEMYDRLRPWIVSHPSVGAFLGEDVCPKCGSRKLVESGVAFMSTTSYRRFRCGSCGSWSRSTKRLERTTVAQIPNS